MNDEIILDECDDESFVAAMMERVEYPCVFLEGITSNEEIEFFRNHDTDEDTSVRAYCSVAGEPISLGKIDLTLHALLTIRSIFDYRISLHKNRDCVITIDLNDPETLIKFIKV